MSGHESQQEAKPKKSRKRLFNFGSRKKKQKKQGYETQDDGVLSQVPFDATLATKNNQEEMPNVHPSQIGNRSPIKPHPLCQSSSDGNGVNPHHSHGHGQHHNHNHTQSTPTTPIALHDDPQQNEYGPDDEICVLVDSMTGILQKLKTMCYTHNTTHHNMNLDRFQKLIDWVAFTQSHMKLLEQAWNDKHFWPFVSVNDAEDIVKENKGLLVIRLSNTKPGAISVTRSSKGLNQQRKWADFVKHKRYLPTGSDGKIILQGSWGIRRVTWDGLVAHIKQKECCICLEELADNEVLRLNCGHHFHKSCIERHVQHSAHPAVCPLCREPIKNADLIQEPTLLTYKPVPNLNKSQSVHAQQKDDEDHMQMERASTFHSTPTDDHHHDAKMVMASIDHGNGVQGKASTPSIGGSHHHWNQMANNLQKRHTTNGHGNHLGVAWQGIDEDEYGNVAHAAQLATKLIAAQGNHH